LNAATLMRDGIWLNRHRALASCLRMIFSENRFTLFRIMLWVARDFRIDVIRSIACA
jgi:hypothetical protein